MSSAEFAHRQEARKERRQDFRDTKKHYVRLKGWLPVLQTYAQVHKDGVKYLSLCGKEAIDIRYFAIRGALMRNAEKNHYPTLTFIESDPEDFAVITETLGRVRLPIMGKIEAVLLDGTHEQHGELVGSFPYHVLNLDFCGDIVPVNDHPYNETLRCVARVVELQAAGGADRWHLFLTFRAQRSMTNENANDQLCRLLGGNLGDPELKAAYGTRTSPIRLKDGSYAEFLRLGVAKFLAHAARNYGVSCQVGRSYIYGRHGGAYHIVKLIVQFTSRRGARDLPEPAGDQAAYKADVIRAFQSEAVDVDQALAGVLQEVTDDLQPVLAELGAMNIVTS